MDAGAGEGGGKLTDELAPKPDILMEANVARMSLSAARDLGEKLAARHMCKPLAASNRTRGGEAGWPKEKPAACEVMKHCTHQVRRAWSMMRKLKASSEHVKAQWEQLASSPSYQQEPKSAAKNGWAASVAYALSVGAAGLGLRYLYKHTLGAPELGARSQSFAQDAQTEFLRLRRTSRPRLETSRSHALMR